MKQYLDSKSEIDINEMEEYQKHFEKEAMSSVEKNTNNLLEEIKFYRSHSFEEVMIVENPNQIKSRTEYFRNLYLKYNEMSEEQIKDYLNLYHNKEVKKELALAKIHAMQSSKNTDISSTTIMEVVKIDYMDKKDKKKKEQIKENLQTVFKTLGVSYGVGFVAWLYAAANYSLAGENELTSLIYGGASAAFAVAAGLVLSGMTNDNDYKKLIKRAKKFGIYDSVAEYLKAEDIFKNFENGFNNSLNHNDMQGKVL